MKVFTIRVPGNATFSNVIAADDPVEAAALTLAKTNMPRCDAYYVYDWDLNLTTVTREQVDALTSRFSEGQPPEQGAV